MNGRPLPGDNAREEDRHLLFWIAVLAAAALFLFRFGYDFGVSDQDEFLPFIAHLIDPDILRSDWLVGIQASSFNVRTIFALLIATLGEMFGGLSGVPTAVHLLFVLSFVGVCLGIYRLALGLHHHAIPAALAVVGVVAVTARWNPGGNDVVHGLLVPSMLAWALALNGLATLWARRATIRRCMVAAILLGMAVAMQPLVGLQVAAVAFVVLLFDEGRRVRDLVLFGGLFLLLAAPVVAPIAASSGLLVSGDAIGLSGSEILARIRAPHHYLPETFGAGRWLRLWVLVAAGAAFLWTRPDRIFGRPRRRLITALSVIVVVLFVSRVVVALDPLGPVTMLQPFKLTVLLRVVAVTAAAGWLTFLTARPQLTLTLLSIPPVVLVLGLYTGAVGPDRTTPFVERTAGPVGDVHAWIRAETDEASTFAVPPSHTGFSWATRRSQYVNFKAVPFSDADLREWVVRLDTVAPFDPPKAGGSPLLARLDRAYHARLPTEWRAVMNRESIDYLLMRRGDHFWYSAEAASYCNSDWCVYSVRELRSIDEWRYATD